MKDWKHIATLVEQMKVESNVQNEPVSVTGSVIELECVGLGTDAAVFHHKEYPGIVFKVFAEDKRHKIDKERAVYERIERSPYFPNFFGATDTFLVISHEEGKTLFDCVVEGIHIPKQVVDDVEAAREYVRSCGLNPRDIHLKNILLQEGRGKIIDVSEYSKPGNDMRWEHLKKGYEEYYHLVDGKAVPIWVVETIRKAYNQWSKHFG